MDEFGKGGDAAQLFRRQLHEQAELRDEIRAPFFTGTAVVEAARPSSSSGVIWK